MRRKHWISGRHARPGRDELERAVVPRFDEGVVDGRIESATGGATGFDGRLGELEQVGSDRRVPGRVELRQLRPRQEARERRLEACELGLGLGETALCDLIARPLEQALDVRAHGAKGVPQHGHDVLVEATGGRVTTRTAGGAATGLWATTVRCATAAAVRAEASWRLCRARAAALA